MLYMYQLVIFLQDHLHFFLHSVFNFSEQFFWLTLYREEQVLERSPAYFNFEHVEQTGLTNSFQGTILFEMHREKKKTVGFPEQAHEILLIKSL